MGDNTLVEGLFAACESGNAAKVEMILSQAATRPSELAKRKNFDGWCPVAVAAYAGHLEVVDALIVRRHEEHKTLAFAAAAASCADEHTEDTDLAFALSLAFGKGHWQIVYHLIDREDGRDLHPIKYFLSLGEPAPVELIAKVSRRDTSWTEAVGESVSDMEKWQRERILSRAVRQKCLKLSKVLMASAMMDCNAPANGWKRRKQPIPPPLGSFQPSPSTTGQFKKQSAPITPTKDGSTPSLSSPRKGKSFGFQVRGQSPTPSAASSSKSRRPKFADVIALVMNAGRQTRQNQTPTTCSSSSEEEDDGYSAPSPPQLRRSEAIRQISISSSSCGDDDVYSAPPAPQERCAPPPPPPMDPKQTSSSSCSSNDIPPPPPPPPPQAQGAFYCSRVAPTSSSSSSSSSPIPSIRAKRNFIDPRSLKRSSLMDEIRQIQKEDGLKRINGAQKTVGVTERLITSDSESDTVSLAASGSFHVRVGDDYHHSDEERALIVSDGPNAGGGDGFLAPIPQFQRPESMVTIEYEFSGKRSPVETDVDRLSLGIKHPSDLDRLSDGERSTSADGSKSKRKSGLVHALKTPIKKMFSDSPKIKKRFSYPQKSSAASSISGDSGDTLLHTAIRSREMTLVNWLLKQKSVDVNHPNDDCDTPLHLAIKTDFQEGAIRMCKLKKSRVNMVKRDAHGDTPLHLAARNNQLKVVQAILDTETSEEILSFTNAGGKTALEVTESDDVAGVIIRDRRFRPKENVTLKTGKTLLLRLCSVETVNFDDLYSKADALFINPIDPCECTEELDVANQCRNFYIVWLLLKAGPSDIDLVSIEFSEALRSGMENDQNMLQDRENFFHVFARTGFTAAIHQVMSASLSSESFLPRLYSTDCFNRDGNHPTMEAAKYNNCDALVLLLHPVLQEAMDLSDEESRKCLDRLLHSRNKDGHTLLYLTSHHQKNLFLPHSMIMHLELQAHGNKHEEIQECIRSNLGSSKMSKETAMVVKDRAPGWPARVLNMVEIFILIFLVPMGFFIMDLVTDGLLVSDYYRDMHNSTATKLQKESILECRNNLTLSCYCQAMRAESKFAISVSIMLFPFVFYLVEVIKHFRLNPPHMQDRISERDDFGHKIKNWYVRLHLACRRPVMAIPFSPLMLLEGLFVWLSWPIRVFLLNVIHKLRLEGSTNHEKIDRHSKNQRAYQNYASRAHLIEVCAESSLQPLLQLYLFLPSLISSFLQIGLLPTIRLADLTSTASVQLFSVMLSVLSVAYSFTTHYRRSKHEAMPTFHLGTLTYFSHTLCLVVSRLLAFVLFAYYFEPGEWIYAASAVLYHVVVMAIIHGIMITRNPDKYGSASNSSGWFWEGCTLVYNCVLNGLANIFVHNKIDDFSGQLVEDSSRMTPRRRATAGMWCLCVNTASKIVEEGGEHVGEGVDGKDKSTTTFFRQSFFDVIFASEICGMLFLGYHSRLHRSDPDFRRSFRPLALTSISLFVIGILLKLLFYAAFHLWSDLIVTRAANACCHRNDNEDEKVRTDSVDFDVNSGGSEEFIEMQPLRGDDFPSLSYIS